MSHWDDTHRDPQTHWDAFKPQVKPSIDWEEIRERTAGIWHLAVDKSVDAVVRLVALREGLR